MWPFKKKIKLADIETEFGNKIIKDLLSKGWKITSEYSDKMFDKSIDYDSYTLKQKGNKLCFEWDNWTEWTIEGPELLIKDLTLTYFPDDSK